MIPNWVKAFVSVKIMKKTWIETQDSKFRKGEPKIQPNKRKIANQFEMKIQVIFLNSYIELIQVIIAFARNYSYWRVIIKDAQNQCYQMS